MINWIVRFFMVLAGLIASILVAREAYNFEIAKMLVAIILFGLIVTVIIFWPQIKNIFKKKNKKK